MSRSIMTMLDELSGFEFEETMGVVFEKLGYENVEVVVKVGDEGRDIVMTEPDPNDVDTAVVVECKHTGRVGRPVIQKLHSAVQTYEYEGPKRGIIATTGRLTSPAKEYAERVDIDVIDGRRLRELAEDIGMDIYNGRIEIICEQGLDPHHPEGPTGPIRSEITDIDNLTTEEIPPPETVLTLVPTVASNIHVNRTFSTTVGVINRIDDQWIEVNDASRGRISELQSSVRSLIRRHLDEATGIDEMGLDETFDSVHRRRFDCTENEYRDRLRDIAIRRTTQTVSYTGDNNVTYERVCEPDRSDVSLEEFTALYTPRIHATVRLGNQEYEMDWFAASTDTAVTADSFHECRVCSDFGEWINITDLSGISGIVSRLLRGPSYTFCENCSRIACQVHTRTERSTGEPVCTGCAVESRFAGAKRYFFNDQHREQFNNDYVAKGPVEKISENGKGAVVAIVVVLFMLMILI